MEDRFEVKSSEAWGAHDPSQLMDLLSLFEESEVEAESSSAF